MDAPEPRCNAPPAPSSLSVPPSRPPWRRFGGGPRTGLSARSLVLAAALCLAVRLPGWNRPLVGNFATKNVVYAMIARNWAEGRAPWWRPTVDVVRGAERSWHLVELPLPAYAVGAAWHTLGGSLDAWGRVLTAVASTAAGLVLGGWLGNRYGPRVAWPALLVWALAPVSVIYGQSFMLEPWVVLLMLVACAAADRYAQCTRPAWLLLAIVALAAALLTKLYLLVWIGLWCQLLAQGAEPGEGFVGDQTATSNKRWGLALAAAALAMLPAVAWYGAAWRWSAPGSATAEHVFYSWRQSTAAHDQPLNYWWSPRFWFGVARDLGLLTLTPPGALLALVALGRRQWLPAAALGGAALLLGLPRKFAEMNYYFVLLVPLGAALTGLGWNLLCDRLKHPRRWAWGLVVSGALVAAAETVRPAFFTPPEDRAVVAAGLALRQLARPLDTVIAVHGSAPELLYYCDRPGWALDPDHPDFTDHWRQAVARGARWLVWVRPELAPVERLPAEALRRLLQRDAKPGYLVYEIVSGDLSPQQPAAVDTR